MVTIEQVESICRTILNAEGLRYAVGVVVTPSGDDTVGYSATLYLNGETSGASEPVRCIRGYVPVASHRVGVLWKGTRPLLILGRVN
jgi:hypothetical protein